MDKRTFSRKDESEKREILEYLRSLMEDHSNLRTELDSLQAKYMEMESQLAAAQALDEERVMEINQWRTLSEKREEEISALQHKYNEAKKSAEASKQEVMNLRKRKSILEMRMLTEKLHLEAEMQMRAQMISVDQEYQEREKALEDKIQILQEKLGSKSVPLSVLAEGLKDYVEESGINEAHTVFVHLNNLLISVPAWTKNVPDLKEFFKKARKEMEGHHQTTIEEYVVNKHVENEVNGVAPGAIGIKINKDKQ
jgi:uncharacterized coiled-coil DUF342 family protein